MRPFIHSQDIHNLMGNGTSSGAVLLADAHQDFFNQRMLVLKLEEGNGYAPCLSTEEGIKEFSTFCSEVKLNTLESPMKTHISACRDNPGQNKQGWIEIMFNDYEHFADCMLEQNLNKVLVKWVSYSEDLTEQNLADPSDIKKALDNATPETLIINFIVRKPVRLDMRENPLYQYETEPNARLLDVFLSIDLLK